MIDLIPLPYKLAAAGVVAAIVFGGGLKAGLWWSAGDLAECESTVESVREISHALEIKNEEQRLLSERVTADSQERYLAAADYWRKHPRLVRVREDCSSAGGMPAFPGSTSGLNAANGIAALSATGITAAECETQLNMGYRDASKHEFLMDWINRQTKGDK